MTTTPLPALDLDEALRLFRTLPADQHPGRLAECAALLLAELERLRDELKQARDRRELYAEATRRDMELTRLQSVEQRALRASAELRTSPPDVKLALQVLGGA